MLKSEIQNLVTCKKFDLYCRNLTKGNKIYEDLKSQVILILLELEDNVFENIISLNAYANQIAFKEYLNKHSSFNKMIGRELEQLSSNFEYIEENDIDKDYYTTVKIIESELLKDVIKEKMPVEHYLFQSYLKYGTVRETARQLNIPRSTIHRIIQSYRKRIKEKTQ